MKQRRFRNHNGKLLVVSCCVAAASACSARSATQSIEQKPSTLYCKVSDSTLVLLERGRVPSPTDTVLAIETSSGETTDVVWEEWLADHPELKFRGEQYFFGPRGLRSWQFENRGNSGRLAAIGSHDGVTVYAWQPYSSPPMVLYFRTDTTCGIRQYWHVSLVRN